MGLFVNSGGLVFFHLGLKSDLVCDFLVSVFSTWMCLFFLHLALKTELVCEF